MIKRAWAREKSIPFQATVPPLGRYEGIGKTGGPWPWYVIPTTSEKLGIPFPSTPYSVNLGPSPNGHNETITIACYVLDKAAPVAGYAKNYGSLNASDRPATITIEYLPGCSLHGSFERNMQYAFFSSTINYDDFNLEWNSWTDDSPQTLRLGSIAPIGPIRLSINLDGYTSDTVEFVSTNLKQIFPNLLVRPKTERPDAIGPQGFEFRQIEDWTTGTLTVTPTNTPAPSDTNSATPTLTLTLTLSPTSSLVPTSTAGPTQTIQPSTSPTISPTATAISSPTAIISPSATPLPSILIISQAILMGSRDAVDMNHDGCLDITDLLAAINQTSRLALTRDNATRINSPIYRMAAIQ